MNLHHVLRDIHAHDRIRHDGHSDLPVKTFMILQLWHLDSVRL
jgi:hypothetical protein